MNTKRLGSCRGFTLSLLGVVLVVPLACGIRHDEFDCENAVAHLVQCCPGFVASAVDCTYSGGCNATYPALDPAQSDCIRGASCGTLVANGVCDRAAQLQNGLGSSNEVASVSVCPGGPVPDAGAVASDDGPVGPFIAACTSASGCTAGEVCCVEWGPGSIFVTCRPPPCSSGLQVCATPAECVGGGTCARQPSLSSVMLCGGGSDASGDALPDVSTPTDAPSEETTDAPSEASTDGSSVPSSNDAAGDAHPEGSDAPDAVDADLSQ